MRGKGNNNKIKCPSCGCLDTRVSNTRPTFNHAAIARRRRCTACGVVITTYEITDTDFRLLKNLQKIKELMN